MRYGRARAGGSAPEDPRGQRAGTEVDDCHERHHRADEHEHRRRVPDQLLAGRPDDLLELGDDLPDEAGDAREETEALGLLAAARTRRGTPGAVGAAGARPCGFAHSWSLRTVCPARRDVLHPSGRTGGCRAGGTRTHNRRFWRPVRYQLRHCPTVARPTTWSRPFQGAPNHGGRQPPAVECTCSEVMGRTPSRPWEKRTTIVATSASMAP